MATFPLKPAAGRSIGVTYKMVRLPAEAAPCVPTALQLAWFADGAGTFSETAEAAYLLPGDEGGAGPVLAVAGILGETCGAPVQWITAWSPEVSGGEPGVLEDGTRLVVWPKPGSGPGLLTVRAFIAGKSYGPIALTVLRYECAGYYPYAAGCVMALDPLTWHTGEVNEVASFDANYGFSAVVSGGWPEGTMFDWVIDDNIDIGTTIMNNAIAVFSNGSGDYGELTATVTVTTPDGVIETLGPITLTVTTGGCC